MSQSFKIMRKLLFTTVLLSFLIGIALCQMPNEIVSGDFELVVFYPDQVEIVDSLASGTRFQSIMIGVNYMHVLGTYTDSLTERSVSRTGKAVETQILVPVLGVNSVELTDKFVTTNSNPRVGYFYKRMGMPNEPRGSIEIVFYTGSNGLPTYQIKMFRDKVLQGTVRGIKYDIFK